MKEKKSNENFLKGYKIANMITEARQIRESKKQFSDVYDDEGNQYVDLVQEGGGVLGIALIGYTYILEQAGIRFYSLAGTSAGAINTMFMAGLSNIGEPVSNKVLDILGSKNLFDFVDGPNSVKRLIQKKIDAESGILLNLIIGLLPAYLNLKYSLGLNPGLNFERWVKFHLAENGINSLKDLNEKRNVIPELYHRENLNITPPKLAIIASEINTHTKVEFPRMAELYWKNIENIPPSEFVRASMAVPYFFYPYVKKNIPNVGNTATLAWKELAGYSGEIPPEVKFVDGGLLSNFPINIFHNNHLPSRPTFGVRLSVYRKTYSSVDSFFSFSGAMISTMRQIYDYDFILKNPDYKKLICHIDADEKYNWLNFNMSFEKQKSLFNLGAEKAIEFLNNFDWIAYKELRKNINS